MSYGPVTALRGVSLEVRRGEIVAVLGPNGAGKSTLLRTIAGVTPAAAGRIAYDGERLDGEPAESVVRRGLALVPEGRMVFPALTVTDNLRVGAISRPAGKEIDADLDRMMAMFPKLKERARQMAGTLSGGEQQQLAIARGLMSKPTLMMLDEPSLGLAPLVVDQVFELLGQLRADGVTLLVVEQNVHLALEIADRAAVLAVGEIVLSGTGEELRATEAGIERTFLGLGAS